MSRYCRLPGCLKTEWADKAEGYTFHLFPKDPERRAKWLESLKLPPDFPITRAVYVCSRHFESNQFMMFKQHRQRKNLKLNAIPTLLFPPDPPRNFTRRQLEDEERISRGLAPKPLKKPDIPDDEVFNDDSSWDDDDGESSSASSSDGEPIPYEENSMETDVLCPEPESVFLDPPPPATPGPPRKSIISPPIEHFEVIDIPEAAVMLTQAQKLLKWAIAREATNKTYLEQAKDAYEKFVSDDEMEINDLPTIKSKREKKVTARKMSARIDEVEINSAVNTAAWSLASREILEFKSMLVSDIDCQEFGKVADMLPAIPMRSIADLKLLEVILDKNENARVVIRSIFDDTIFLRRTLYSFIWFNLRKILGDDCIRYCSWSGIKKLSNDAYFELRTTTLVNILDRSARHCFKLSKDVDIAMYCRKALYNTHWSLKEEANVHPHKQSITKFMNYMEREEAKEREVQRIFGIGDEVGNEEEEAEEADWVKNLTG